MKANQVGIRGHRPKQFVIVKALPSPKKRKIKGQTLYTRVDTVFTALNEKLNVTAAVMSQIGGWHLVTPLGPFKVVGGYEIFTVKSEGG